MRYLFLVMFVVNGVRADIHLLALSKFVPDIYLVISLLQYWMNNKRQCQLFYLRIFALYLHLSVFKRIHIYNVCAVGSLCGYLSHFLASRTVPMIKASGCGQYDWEKLGIYVFEHIDMWTEKHSNCCPKFRWYQPYKTFKNGHTQTITTIQQES